ncbi:MAG TPA: hypothetical protein VGN15_08930, partial [Ktedonobacteraceae bacterium]|nr:hypothetical protein [Ktedonobacteraceae bacterium]
EVAERIGVAIDSTADITFGAVIDPMLKDTIRVTLIAAGMEERSTLRIPAIHLNQVQATPAQPVYRPSAAPPVAQQTPMRPASHDVQPVARPQAARPATQPQQSVRPLSQPGRQQRSLDDLRGIRGMGRRQEQPGVRQTGEDNEEEAVDVPPFMKRFP